MKKLIRFDEVSNPHQVAEDLQRLLSDRSNDDIGREFPNLAKRYSSGTIQQIAARILIDKTLQEDGRREWYLAYKDSTVVGFGAINLTPSPIAGGLDVDSPNLAGFIGKPYRGEGIGRFSLEERLRIVRSRFGGVAWMLVGLNNETSNQMILSTPGFVLCDRTTYKDEPYNLYEYSARQENRGGDVL